MSSPSPKPQSLSPTLPRLLWLHAHLLKWIWLGLYAVGLALMLYLIAMGPQYHIELTNMLPQSFIGLTGCFLVVAICLLYAGEKEEHLHEFPLHRGWNPFLIHTSKIALSLVLYIALIAALYLSRTILTTILRIKLNTAFTDPEFAYAFYLPALLLAWSFLSSQHSKTVLNAIGLTFTGIILQAIIVGLTTNGFQFIPMIAINAIMITLILLATNTRTASFLQSTSQNIANTLQIPSASGSLPKTEHLSRDKSTRFHLNWLHTHERRLTWTTGIAIVLFSLVFFPLISFGFDDGAYPLLFSLVIPAFCCAAPLLTFQPEHAQSNYRFWNDRGIPWQSILRSRLLGFLIPHLTIITLSLAALIIGFLFIIAYGPNPNITFPDLQLEFRRIAERDPQFFPTIRIALAILLPIATITAFFYSWMFRSPLVAFVIQLLTLIALFAYAAITYIGLDIPLWLTLYPLAAVIFYLTLSRYPIRFQPEIPTSLYRTNTLAIIATFIVSLTATAFYRVYQVPDVTADLPVITDALLMHRLATSSSPQPFPTSSTFQSQFDEINRNIKEYPSDQLTSLSQTGIDSYHRHLVNNYGFDYALPSIQAWTIEHQAQATSFKKLVLETPGSQLYLKNETFIGNAHYLLSYSAKYHESLGDLQTAADFYIAHNRLLELLSSSTLGDPLRSHHRVALTSWLNHPAQPINNRDQLLLKMLARPDDAMPPQDRLAYVAHQIHEKLIQTPTSQLIDEANKNGSVHWTSWLYYLPTERWRAERLLMLRYKIQHLELGLYAFNYLDNRDFFTFNLNGSLSIGINDVYDDGKLYEQLRQTTPLVDELSNSLQQWSPSEIRNLKSYANHHILSYAQLLLTLAHTDLKLDPVPDTPAVATALERLLSQTRLSPRLAEHLQQQLRSRDFTIAQNGINAVNGQYNQPKYNLDTIGQQILILVESTQPPYYTHETSKGRYLQIVNADLTLANLNQRPPIPNYDELAQYTPEQLLDYFRNPSLIKPTPATPGIDN